MSRARRYLRLPAKGRIWLAAAALALGLVRMASGASNAVLNISGTYPHLAVFSPEGEVGIGAVAAWADKLWFITYPPHFPHGSGDKLWTVDGALRLEARPESVGGTHANRMIHRETQQLILGPYWIDSGGRVRVISPKVMPGRLTATARHLTDPAHRVYYFTMEKGLYDVDISTLEVKKIYPDRNDGKDFPPAPFPGAHGKGGYSGQGRLVLANNGERGWSLTRDPGLAGPAGALAEHSGSQWAEPWGMVERKNFTEVTGPGGLAGNANPGDPIWSLGWDQRSVLLKLLDHGVWHTYRLPKASFSHDALHGWYTEWPRIREITDGKMLMHMHGMFYDFPKDFAADRASGITPICTYLRMPVDYCWFRGQLVMARDDAATTGGNRWAGESNSALWFGQLSDLGNWGAPAGFGGPWREDDASALVPSDPFLVSGFAQRILHVRHATPRPVQFAVQFKSGGAGAWNVFTNLWVPPRGYAWCLLPAAVRAEWVRLVPNAAASGVTANFILANPPTPPAPALFAGLADISQTNSYSDGVVRARTGDARALEFAANVYGASGGAGVPGLYRIGGDFRLQAFEDAAAERGLRADFGLEKADFSADSASVLCVSGTNRFRLPKGDPAYDRPLSSGWPRGVREVVTERNLFQAHGTFYELPREDAGGIRRLRPVATHHKRISDFASWRGLLALAGVSAAATNDGHVFRSTDGRTALWFGNVDDLWRLGPPTGRGGPWKDTAVTAGIPSDPYLMLGYQGKILELSHHGRRPVTFTVEVDFSGDDRWSEYGRFTVAPGAVARHAFPDGYSAHWVRLKADTGATVSAIFTYLAGPAAASD